MAATTFMRSWQHFEFVMLATLPMFLFSTTFYPLSVYPRPLQLVVDVTPLYQGIALLRGLTLGFVGPSLLWHRALPGCHGSGRPGYRRAADQQAAAALASVPIGRPSRRDDDLDVLRHGALFRCRLATAGT